LEDRFAPFESDTLLPDAIINMEEENAELEDIVKLFSALIFPKDVSSTLLPAIPL